jgi:hypothetical protein
MRRGRDPITELRRAIDALPERTRSAMLEGIRAHPIVVGAYTDDRGGICPMLAAHRHGGRTTLLAFARSWDRFAGARRVRRASRRELAVLEQQLMGSRGEPPDTDLGAAIAEHQALRRRTAERAAAATEQPERTFRPRRADAKRALARLDVHVLASSR